MMTLAMVCSLIAFAAPQEAYAQPYSPGVVDAPIGVVGRTLTPAQTGDIADWIEIAQNGPYSLIVRQKFVNTYMHDVMYGTVVRDNPVTQSTNGYGKAPFHNTNYFESGVRDKVNAWFNGDAPGDADKLPVNARLRAFTMQVFPQDTFGTSSSVQAVVDGFSKPTKYQVGVGDDIAFLLSFGEVANFLSLTHYQRGSSIANKPSSDIAKANYNRMGMTNISGYGMWLRSPGDLANSVGFLADRFGSGAGRAFQNARTSTTGLLYPALWVDANIFTASTKTPPAPIITNPVVVDGRILTPDMTGDISDWVEIAQVGDFSLIVRKNFVNIYMHDVMYGTVVRDNPATQTTNGYAKSPNTSSNYMDSGPRDKVNQWFNGTAPGDADKLPADARLRDYTVQTTTKYHLGTCTTHLSVVDGYSKPTHYQAGIGNDVAFLLSYGESASFLSKIHYLRGNFVNNVYVGNQPSNPIAQKNYDKVSIPNLYLYGMWLRSLGDVAGTVGFLDSDFDPYVGGRVFQSKHVAGNVNTGKGLIYPALWVGSGIFPPVVGPPTEVEAEEGNEKIALLWRAPIEGAGDITHYEIKIDDGPWVSYAIGDLTYHSGKDKWFLLFEGLTNNQEYTFLIRAITSTGLAGEAFEIQATPDPLGGVGGEEADLISIHGVTVIPPGGWPSTAGASPLDPHFALIEMPRDMDLRAIHRNFITASEDATYVMYNDLAFSNPVDEIDRVNAQLQWLSQVRVYLKVTSGNTENIMYYEIVVRAVD
jgi:hypothetical protein